ncbi:MAG: Rieske 2Fe-2S domain-containing protein [Planctomycetota bacterium]
MSGKLQLVQWNAHKKLYDIGIVAFVIVAIGTSVLGGRLAFPPPTEVSAPILLMRALGTTAIIMLHVILAIGPLARLTPLAAPLLYNRRHLGVTFFLITAFHATIAVGFYGGFGQGVWLINVVTGGYRDGAAVPFEFLGFFALMIFFAMAATSHDFWLSFLGPTAWKWLHMLVYVAYALVVGHVILGAAVERGSVIVHALLSAGVVTLTGLHLVSGLRSIREQAVNQIDSEWADAGPVGGIPDDRARVVRLPSGDSVAIFRHDGRLTAMSNVCKHQGGPLGEGKVVNGCVTCPWHGYQYRPGDGCSPPPYTEQIATYDVRISADRVEVCSKANELGSRAESPVIGEDQTHAK